MGTVAKKVVIAAVGFIGGALLVGIGMRQSFRLGRIVVIRETERPTPTDEKIDSIDLMFVEIEDASCSNPFAN